MTALLLALLLTDPFPYPSDCPEGAVNGVFFNYQETETPQGVEYILFVFRAPQTWPWPSPAPSTYWPWSNYARVFSQERAQRLAWRVGRCGFHGGGPVTEDPGVTVPGELLYVEIKKRPWEGK